MGQVESLAIGQSTTVKSVPQSLEVLTTDPLLAAGADGCGPDAWAPGIPNHSVIYLTASVDANNTIVEYNEDNNLVLTTFRYPTGPADPGYDAAEDPDGDGWTAAQGDCGPDDPEVYPGAPEIPGHPGDNDCAGGNVPDSLAESPPGTLADPAGADLDGDGYTPGTTPQAAATQGGDCNDSNAAQHPGATEVEDGLDNDCDGLIDEGFRTPDWIITAFNVARTDPRGASPGVTFSAAVENTGPASGADDMGPGAGDVAAEYVQYTAENGQALIAGSSEYVPYTAFPTQAERLTAACGGMSFVAALPSAGLFGEENIGNNSAQAGLTPVGDSPYFVARQPGLDYNNSNRTLPVEIPAMHTKGDCIPFADLVTTIRLRIIVGVNGQQLVEDSATSIAGTTAVALSPTDNTAYFAFGDHTFSLIDRIRRHDEASVEVVVNPDAAILQDPRNNNRSVTTYRYKTPAFAQNYFEVLGHEVGPAP